MFFSIIIPAKNFNKFLEETIKRCLELDYSDFEIIILPDEHFEYHDERVKIIATGIKGPAEKRDEGAVLSKGDILAFIDDDAYPSKEWLRKASEIFKDEKISAVCGPAITPFSDKFLSQISGLIFSSAICSGKLIFRYKPFPARFVDDFPSCNFMVRKTDFEAVGGFSNCFWPGEDTIFCLKIINNLQKKIYYSPSVLVYHHRRPVFKEHLKQVKNYAIHRGYFVKKFPQNSLKLIYFLPAIFFLFLVVGGFFCIFNLNWLKFYIFILFLYFLVVFCFSFYEVLSQKIIKGFFRKLLSVFLIFIGIILTHLVYGFNFIYGLFIPKLKEEI